jgi:hypothetical protein
MARAATATGRDARVVDDIEQVDTVRIFDE